MSSGDESCSDFEFADDDVEESSTILDCQDEQQLSLDESPRDDGSLQSWSGSASDPPPKRLSLNDRASAQSPNGGQQPGGAGGAPLSRRRRSSKQECFIEKLFKMATCKDHSAVFGFSEDGSYIEIRTPSGLAQVLKRYFKHSNSSSFVRQLNNYGFKTMSSVSTGNRNIQCFIHPQFKRDSPADLEKITRKTARVLKKCKREIIKELQNGEAACRKRVKDLESMNAKLESDVRRLERENAMLVQEISGRAAAHQPQAPCLASNRSSLSSEGRIVEMAHRGRDWSREHSGHSSTTSLNTMTSASASSCDAEYYMVKPSMTMHPRLVDGSYLEPMLEMVSDYSDESPLFSTGLLQTQPGPLFIGGLLPDSQIVASEDYIEDQEGFLVSRPPSSLPERNQHQVGTGQRRPWLSSELGDLDARLSRFEPSHSKRDRLSSEQSNSQNGNQEQHQSVWHA